MCESGTSNHRIFCVWNISGSFCNGQNDTIAQGPQALGSKPSSLLLKDLISDFIFDFTAAGVVPCGGRKTSPRTSTIVQFIFYFGPLRSAIIF